MANRDQLIGVFEDTMAMIRESGDLTRAVQASLAGTRLWKAEETPALPERRFGKTEIIVTGSRSLEAAVRLMEENPGARVMVHNFASATRPGGGVTRGSSAQEEALCRCTTLYPVLSDDSLWRGFYQFHRDRHDSRYTDACIWTPGIVGIKTDTALPRRLERAAWRTIDVITCAAPNLRERPSNAMNPGSGPAVRVSAEELLDLHRSRARHMLSVAAASGAEILVLGAFGCGAFRNDPQVVARAYREILEEMDGQFRKVEFAVYTSSRDRRNQDAFRSVLGG